MFFVAIIVGRALSVALAVIFTLISIVSCGEAEQIIQAGADITGIPIDGEGGVLSILQSRGDIGLPLQQAIELYASANGSPRISVHTVANPHDYAAALRARMLSGERADLFHIQAPGAVKAMRGELDDLSDLEWLSRAMPGTLDAVTAGDAVYGVPYSITGAGLVVNLQIFRGAGIFFGNRPTLESLEEAFKELWDQIQDGELADAFPRLEAVTELAAMDENYLGTYGADLFLTGSFGSVSEASGSDYLEPAGSDNARDFYRLMALYSPYNSWRQLTTISEARMVENGIATGRVAAIYHSAEVYRRIAAVDRELAGNLAIFPVPVGTEEDPYAAVFTGVPVYWAVGAQSTPENKEEARKLLTWLYHSDSGAAEYAGRFMAVSPFRQRVRETGNPLDRQLLRHIDMGNSRPMLHPGAPEGWAEEFAASLQQFYSREISWDDLADGLTEQWYQKLVF